MSLFYTGSQQEAIRILLALLDNKDEYSLLAQDALFLISSELRKYDIIQKDTVEKEAIGNIVPVKYKESLLQKLINKIKKIFNRK